MSINEINYTGAALLANAKVIQLACDKVNDNYLRCKAANPNPAACITQNREVTECALNAIQSLPPKCKGLANEFTNCLNQNNLKFTACRESMQKYYGCLGLESEYTGTSKL